MTRTRRPAATAISVPLTALLLASSVAAPLLERADQSHAPVAESQHEPGTCPAPHDHTVCRQLSANQAAPKAHRGQLSVGVDVREGRVGDVVGPRDLRSERGASARAPPLA